MIRRVPSAIPVLAVLAAVLAAGWVLMPHGETGGAEAETVVTIASGESAAGAARTLEEADVVSSAMAFRWLLRLSGSSGMLHAGEYRFTGAASPLGVLAKLRRGEVILHAITIPEGLRMAEVFDLLAAAELGDRAGLEEAGRDVTLLAGLDDAATDLEGYLAPDTYHFPRGYPARRILAGMVERFRQVFGEDERRRAEELGMTVREVVTLASLVEKETGHPPERPLVASVFHNRLRRRMLLQCDPTIIYALLREGRYEGRLLRADLRFDSPYNTYLYPGLPPGPIANPGPAALEAALHPSETDLLYFVSMNDGTHHFSRRLEEHQRAVDRYQRSGRGR